MPLTQVKGGGIANDAVSTTHIATGAVTVADIPDGEVTGAKIADDVALGGNPTTTTQSASNNSTCIATTAYVDTAVGNLSQDSMTEGNTKAEVVDTGSDGHFLVETEGTERLRVIADGKVGIGTSTPSVELEVSGTGAIEIPQGTTAERPTGTNAERAGLIRYNTETDLIEFFNEVSNSWVTVGVQGGMIKTADPTIPDEIIEETSPTVTNPTVIGGSGTISFTYQWMVELSGTYTNIPSGTSQSVTLPAQVSSTDVLGNKVRCTVTATDGDGFTLVINSNETTVTEFTPNMNPVAGLAVNWNPGSNSGGEASSIGFVSLPNNEKAIDVTGGGTYHVGRYCLSDAGKIYLYARDGTGTITATHQTGNQFEWSGKTIKGFWMANATGRPSMVATTGEYRYSTDSGSSWDEWLTTTSGFSKVVWHNGYDQHSLPIVVTEDGNCRYGTTVGQYKDLAGSTGTHNATFMGVYIDKPSNKKICYVAILDPSGAQGAVLLCNDQRLYAVGNTGVSGFPTNGTRSTPVIVSSVTTKFKQIGNLGNSGNSNFGFQAIDTEGNYWVAQLNNSDTFSKHFDSTGVTIKSLFGAQLAPYIDNCCTYNQRDLMAIGDGKILHTNNLPAGGTTINEYTLPSSFPSWDHTKVDHGGRTAMTPDHSGDWASIILPQ